MIDSVLRQTVFHNTVLDYLISIGVLILGFMSIWFVKRVYLQRFKSWTKKTETSIDDFIVNSVEKTVAFGLFRSL